MGEREGRTAQEGESRSSHPLIHFLNVWNGQELQLEARNSTQISYTGDRNSMLRTIPDASQGLPQQAPGARKSGAML